MRTHNKIGSIAASAAVALTLAGCGGSSGLAPNVAPDGLRVMKMSVYDGSSDDLATAGVGLAALLDSSTLPTYQNPAQP
ncbi:MAG: 3HB-oligomer hydrolase, partial [Rhizobacter sp.]|nr:3HB-oligomer hydrolase [Rhizobacter sp.]